MAYDLSYLTNTMEKLDVGGNGGVRYFNMKNRNQTVIRLIPITQEKPVWLVAYHYNFDNTVTSKILCPARTAVLNDQIVPECPVCKHALEVPSNERKRWMPRDRVIFYVIDAAEVHVGVKVMDLSVYVARELASMVAENPDKFLDLAKGHPIKISKVVNANGSYYYNYVPVDDKVVDLTKTVQVNVNGQAMTVNIAELIESTKPDPEMLFAFPSEAELKAFINDSFEPAQQNKDVVPTLITPQDYKADTAQESQKITPPTEDLNKLQSLLSDVTDSFGG